MEKFILKCITVFFFSSFSHVKGNPCEYHLHFVFYESLDTLKDPISYTGDIEIAVLHESKYRKISPEDISRKELFGDSLATRCKFRIPYVYIDNCEAYVIKLRLRFILGQGEYKDSYLEIVPSENLDDKSPFKIKGNVLLERKGINNWKTSFQRRWERDVRLYIMDFGTRKILSKSELGDFTFYSSEYLHEHKNMKPRNGYGIKDTLTSFISLGEGTYFQKEDYKFKDEELKALGLKLHCKEYKVVNNTRYFALVKKRKKLGKVPRGQDFKDFSYNAANYPVRQGQIQIKIAESIRQENVYLFVEKRRNKENFWAITATTSLLGGLALIGAHRDYIRYRDDILPFVEGFDKEKIQNRYRRAKKLRKGVWITGGVGLLVNFTVVLNGHRLKKTYNNYIYNDNK
ncbi:MAG: hypothetical protein MRZ79_04685 [Bacteroidia bacterium]|nr:hypothetical protein [Bacteroidia bacterium]